MMFLKLLLNSVLIFIGETAALINNNWENNSDLTTGHRLPDYIQPTHYLLTFQFSNVEAKNFSGDCIVQIRIEQPTWNISLHAQQPRIKIKYFTLMTNGSSNHYIPTNSTYNNESHILIFHFFKEVSEGDYILQMKFDTILDDGESIFITSIVNEKGYES